MVCVYCGGPTQVINSRRQKQTNSVWRRRTCKRCRNTFTTTETVAGHQAIMVSRDGGRRLLPFSRDTLFVSLYHSCRHRQSAIGDATALTDTITGLLTREKLYNGVISQADIIKTATTVLRRFDQAAASYYEAYYSRS